MADLMIPNPVDSLGRATAEEAGVEVASENQDVRYVSSVRRLKPSHFRKIIVTPTGRTIEFTGRFELD